MNTVDDPLLAGLLFMVPLIVILSSPIWITVIVVVVRHRRRTRDGRVLRAWAGEHGFAYRAEDPSLARLSGRAPFGVGAFGKGVHVLRGPHRGEPVLIFQYRYQTTGEHKEIRRFQVVAVPLPKAVPLLDIGVEGDFSKRFTGDIDFENQAFNDHFKVDGPDRRFAYDIVHARTMEWMLADQRAREFGWRFEGPWLMSVSKGEVDLPDAFARADFLHEVRAQVPQYVWDR